MTAADVALAQGTVEAKLDGGFFRVRIERTSELEQRYLRAMAELARAAGAKDVADAARPAPREQLAPIRARLIEKGPLYTPGAAWRRSPCRSSTASCAGPTRSNRFRGMSDLAEPAAVTSYSVAEDGVALIRLERPRSRNAIDTQMLGELLEHLAVARGDEAVRVLVFSSADHMGFSAGADVREELDHDGHVRRMEMFSDLYDTIVAFPKPTVAACHGDVVGGGAEISIACDLRVGGSNLRMRFPGAALGMPVGPARLVTLCGLAAAKYLLLPRARSVPTRRSASA